MPLALATVNTSTDSLQPTARSVRVGFLGPFGTFTEQAVRSQSDLGSGELVAFRSVPDVLDAVDNGDVDFGVVPIENSIEGTVNFTQDALSFNYNLLIQSHRSGARSRWQLLQAICNETNSE